MTTSQPLQLSHRLLTWALWLNLLMGAGIVLLLAASLVDAAWVMDALGGPPVRQGSRLDVAMRLVMGVGIVSTPVTHVVLSRLRALVETVRHGSPFVAGNATRLTQIAWAVLTLELLHLAVGLIASTVPANGESLDINWTFSLTRWLAVLLLFVLARVFEQGAAMREELEATV